MSVSLPSKPIVTVDIPEVDIKDVEFVYNFYLADESVNEIASLVVSHGTRQELDSDSAITDSLISKIPRFVRIDFTPIGRLTDNGGQQVLVEKPAELENVLISENMDRITFEHDLSNFSFTGIGFQDTGIDQKLFELLSGSLALKLDNLLNPPVSVPKPELKQAELSLLEAANFMNELTGENVDEHFITDTLVNHDEAGIIFINNESKVRGDIYAEIKKTNIQVQLDNRILYDVINNLIDDPMSIYSDELFGLLDRFRSIQLDSKSTAMDLNDGIDINTYDSLVNFVRLVREEQMSFTHQRKIIGYIVDKIEVFPDGSNVEKLPLLIENPDANHAFDPSVKYGATYVYSMRTIASITFQATAINHPIDEDPKTYIVETLISSKPSNKVQVTCTENVPPPPPADFNVQWDFGRNLPRLIWNFPVNPQRDVTRFQIFRRRSVEEPFELLRLYDFDHSIKRIEGDETVDPLLIDRLEGARNLFIDEGFNIDLSYIYAVCCVDARGLSSNYSTQFEVRFNPFKNRLVKRLVSIAGAPKSFPNLELDADAFLDVIKVSGYERVKVYFDPEYLRVFTKNDIKLTKSQGDNQGEAISNQLSEIPIICTDKGKAKYRFQMINTDLQKQKCLEITIADKRTKPSGG